MNRGFVSGLSGKLTPTPVYDGRNDGRSLPGFVVTPPMQALKEEKVPSIPLLTGVTRDETGRAVNGVYDVLLVKINYLNCKQLQGSLKMRC